MNGATGRLWAILVMAGLWSSVASAVAEGGGPRPLEHKITQPGSTSVVQRLAGGDVVLGEARLFAARREIVIPCEINQTNGVIEYFLVHREGKVHESLLKTSARPRDIHALSLLLAAQPVQAVREVEVSVRPAGSTHSARAEAFVWDKLSGKAMRPGLWSYRGSRMESGQFLAEREGSILSVIADPAALADNPQPGGDLDDNWWVNTNAVHSLTGRVDVIFRFP